MENDKRIQQEDGSGSEAQAMNVAFKDPQTSHSLDALAEELLLPSGIDGVYARTAAFEDIVTRLGIFISRHREQGTEVLRFPPVMSRRQLERSGYLKSFPHFLGCVCCLSGSEADVRGTVERFEAGEAWTDALDAADLVLTPAACYPVYPIVASRGEVPAAGLLFDVASDCFRREPSRDLDRLQSFRMREYVCVGTPEQIDDFRTRWIERAQELARQLALPYCIEQASDAFFGRGGKLMAMSQIEQALKFELLVPVHSAEKPTACMSFNYHRDHFGKTWNLHDRGGAVMHTGCVAFGMDRLALAMFATHGLETARWPEAARKALGL
jgi:seryl-tRNA synthetase